MKQTLPQIRVKEQTVSNMNAAIAKFNKDKEQVIEFPSLAEFRRYCYEVTSQMILQGQKIAIKHRMGQL